MYPLRRIWNPALYQGANRRHAYFEGWYFKQISADKSARLAIIPGISRGALGPDPHAFIQTFDGISGETHYHRFPVEAFSANLQRFEIQIGPNRFSPDGLDLDIDRPGFRMQGSLHFDGGQGWPVELFSPGIMGPYTFVPFMECNHGLLSFDHEISGTLTHGGRPLDFTGGRGYIEKDWGAAFPSAHIWLQTNHFRTPRVCLSASVATIPWLGASFKGYIVGLWIDGTLHAFTTYNGGRSEHITLSDQAVEWRLARGPWRLSIQAERAQGSLLAAPAHHGESARLMETLTARAEVRLSRLSRGREEVIFHETGDCAGLEIQGALGEIIDTDHSTREVLPATLPDQAVTGE